MILIELAFSGGGNVKEWELARYLIDAKKCVDSLMYINENKSKIVNLDLKEIIDAKTRLYYINLYVIFDHSYSKKELKELKENNLQVKRIFYERDKNNAHKDIDYKKEHIKNMIELIEMLKKRLILCFDLCKSTKNITITFINYDRNLFRFINMISPELEKKINDMLYLNNMNEKIKEFELFDDTEDIRSIGSSKDYAILLKNGLNLKEGLQNRQDACIKINVLYNENIWVEINDSELEILNENEKLSITLMDEIRKKTNE